MIKTTELKGIKSLKALNAFSALLLGVKMLPAYLSETYEDFLHQVHLMPREDQAKIFREAVAFVDLDQSEIEGVVSFCIDANGVPYGPANIKNLSPKDLVEMIVEVMLLIADFKIDLVSDSEKKKSATLALT